MTSEPYCPVPVSEADWRLDQGEALWDPKPAARVKRHARGNTAAAAVFKHVVCSEDCLAEGGRLGECEPDIHAAHVVPAAELRKRGLEHLVYDPLNGVALCARHHRRHDNWTEKIPRHLLPARCFAWAESHQLTDALERAWPA